MALRRMLREAQVRAKRLDLVPGEAAEALAGADLVIFESAQLLLKRIFRLHPEAQDGEQLLALSSESEPDLLLRVLAAANYRRRRLSRVRAREVAGLRAVRLAEAEAAREAKRQRIADMDASLHGLVGYNDYGCRCGKCRSAYTKDSKQREQVRQERAKVTRLARKLAHAERVAAMDPTLHGVTGYNEYGCRCLICREAETIATKERLEEWQRRRLTQRFGGVVEQGGIPEISPLEVLRRSLCERFQGVSLDAHFSGEVVQTSHGACLDIQTQIPGVGYPSLEREVIEAAIMSQLCLLDHIGAATMARLQSMGYQRITDLVDHYIHGVAAAQLIGTWTNGRVSILHETIVRRLGGWAGASLGVHLGCLFPSAKVVILDLETLGLGGAAVFLFGIAEYSPTGLNVHQFLARDGSEEPAALIAALDRLRTADVVLTYNGRSADLPWLRQRALYYRVGEVPDFLHLDLLPVMQYRKRHDLLSGSQLVDCRLPTVAATLLGVVRDSDDIPSWAIPEFYRSYEQEHNIGPLVPIVEHNQADLAAVGHLYNKLLSEVCCD